MNTDFTKIAIVNRGEPAMRFINAVREYNQETDLKLRTIAFYTEPDQNAMFVREADEAYNLGTATFVDKRDGERKIRYLDYECLETALKTTGAEAVWVGWGFVAEHAEFVDLCDRLGIAFIGPSAEVMRNLGDKITSKQIAEKANVPVTPWSGDAVETLEDARHHAQKIGYPLMIKATAGGGGRGIRKVENDAQLEGAFLSARSEALKGFGDDRVFLEKMMQNARHVEVQIIGDHYGTVWAAGVRDCSAQRRNQKVIEEAPSPALSEEQHEALREAAVRMGETLGYQNAGTVEFLFDTQSGNISFMEVNARLQVEHPVTELTTGLDMVKLQIHVARGGKLEGTPPPTKGFAIEVRFNAEDPANNFAPAPGRVELFRPPVGPGIRVDTGVSEGDTIAPEFDSMIAKIIAFGRNREEALSRLRRALSQTSVVIKGGMSNKGFLLKLLKHEDFIASNIDIGWLDRLVKKGEHTSRQFAEIALIQAAIETYLGEIEVEKARFFSAAHRGRPGVKAETGLTVELGYEGESYKFKVFRTAAQKFRIAIEGCQITAIAEPLGRSEWRLNIDGKNYRVFSMVKSHPHLVEVNGVPHRVMPDQDGVVRAPAPAVVISTVVKENDTVKTGDRLAVLEAMKMEMAVLADFPGTVKQVLVRNNMQVDTGEPLLVIEADAEEKEVAVRERIGFQYLAAEASVSGDARQRCVQKMEVLKELLLGFDADAVEMKRIIENRGILCIEMPPKDRPLWDREGEILNIFVDIISLFRREPADDEGLDASGRLSSEEYLFAYLRNPSAGDEALPPAFVDKLKRVLAHYDVDDIADHPSLELSLFRICKSHQRMDKQIGPILSILERRLDFANTLAPYAGSEFRNLLNRLIIQTEGRYQSVHDLARDVHYCYYDQPLLESVRKQIYQEVNTILDNLETNPRPASRENRVNKLVQCPQPLQPLLSNRFENAGAEMRYNILEIMTRRFYRIRELEDIRQLKTDPNIVLSAEYDYQEKRIHLLTSHSDYENLSKTAETLCPLIKEIPVEHHVLIDFYVWQRDTTKNQKETVAEICRVLNETNFPRWIRRVVVAISGPQSEWRTSGVTIYTFRHHEDGFTEDKVYRGMHTMMAKRLEIWRLKNFDIERLPATMEDIYMFKAVSKENSTDERLFVFAEVRDLTPATNGKSNHIQLPNLELMFMESLESIRRYQAQLPPHRRLYWNRVLLYVWPELKLKPEEVQGIVNRLQPATRGLGLEKVVARARIPNPKTGDPQETIIEMSQMAGGVISTRFRSPSDEPIRSINEYSKKVVKLRRRGLLYPYQLIRMLTPDPQSSQSKFPPGEFIEYDLNENNELVPVERSHGENQANIIVGVIRNFTERYPEGMARVALLGDPIKGMGNLAETECRLINAGLELAQKMNVPVEWFALSAGARIAMDSGTENMDWIALVLRRIVEFTQNGGEINVIVTGINVGAQPYWNAEATMLMHTRGILVMMPESAMVLTGKQALEYSGGVAAEDNQGIGGYERIMGPNGQAQYFAHDLGEACQILFNYYAHSYVAPGERFPRKAKTQDPGERDICQYPHGSEFELVGDVFSAEKNPGRKKPFDIRKVMMAVIDQDHPPLERWLGMQDAEVGVIWDAHIGGYPVCAIGFESRPLARLGFVPADGPRQWTSGTLFPRSSKKIARAINAASNSRPLVVIANLSGFDGSPESLREWQLEYGAEIGRAVVNFKGPVVFCVVSRYHGGAFVVFSNKLNDNMEVVALEGAYASVIGGAPAAAVVFARQVKKRTDMDSRIVELKQQIEAAQGAEKVKLQSQWNEQYQAVYSEMLGQVADEFDSIHSIQRAQQVGSVDRIIPPSQLRPYLVEAIERGMQKEEEKLKVTKVSSDLK